MNDGDRKKSTVGRFLLHLHPKKVDENAIKYNRTFGLGGMAALLFVILSATGMILRFSYVPIVDRAYDSLINLSKYYVFGHLLRNIHYWSANLMVVVVCLHVVRVLYSQSIYFERRTNWLFGLVLLFIVLSFNFTGYLLPWDQLSYWAVTIMTEILGYIPLAGSYLGNLLRGGNQVGQNTLMNFYVLHTGLLPLLMLIFTVLHLWLVRKAKGVTTGNNNEKRLVDVNPHLIRKEIIATLGVIGLVLFLSVFFNAPLKEMANPLISPNPSKAPWYFMGLQEFLLHIHPSFVAFVLPLAVLLLFVGMSYQKSEGINVGVWFNSVRGKRQVFNATVFSFILTLILILATEYILDFRGWFPTMPLIISTGLFPLLLFVIPATIYIGYLKKKLTIRNPELLMALVTIVIVSYLVMTITGICFRGESMKLVVR